MAALVTLAERGLLPDVLTRAGMRRLLSERLREERSRQRGGRERALSDLLARMRDGPVAVETGRANEQHYEVPAAFFRLALGPRMKYSCCHFDEGVADLATAEDAMLRLSCERAEIADGMDVLDLGCGWGSLSLWIASRHPACRVLAVSNSASQREFIENDARVRGIRNVEVTTADMNAFDAERRFDRIVSVEMFEHMRNWELLLKRIASWTAPGGKLFVHVFCHRDLAYFFETDGKNDWMARHFFTGGLMPSEDLLPSIRGPFETAARWSVDGRHYEKTLLAWLRNMDGRRVETLGIFRDVYGDATARVWYHRWRLFFLACAELFGYGGGAEWRVGQYLLEPGGNR